MGCCGSTPSDEVIEGQEGQQGAQSKIAIEPKDDSGTFKARDWKALMNKLPVERTESAAKRRKKIWDQMNAYGNGSVSLRKMKKDMEKYLGLPEKVTKKGCVEMAYNNARGKVKTKNPGDDNFIQFAEFRIFLCYLKQYIEYWVMFENLGAKGENMTLTLPQLKESQHILESYGVKVDSIESEFKMMDKNKSGNANFDDFVDYAIKKELETESNDDYDGNTLKLYI